MDFVGACRGGGDLVRFGAVDCGVGQRVEGETENPGDGEIGFVFWEELGWLFIFRFGFLLFCFSLAVNLGGSVCLSLFYVRFLSLFRTLFYVRLLPCLPLSFRVALCCTDSGRENLSLPHTLFEFKLLLFTCVVFVIWTFAALRFIDVVKLA